MAALIVLSSSNCHIVSFYDWSVRKKAHTAQVVNFVCPAYDSFISSLGIDIAITRSESFFKREDENVIFRILKNLLSL